MTVVHRFSKRGWFVLLTATDARSVAVMFNGKPRAGNSQEIPISQETGEKSLNLGNSRVTGISRGSGNSRAAGSSRILEAITFSSGIQITI